MKIHQQLKVITYCFAGLISLLILLFLSGAFGIKTLMQRQVYVDNANEVMNLTEIAENNFSKADFAGRSAVLSGQKDENLSALRMDALESLRGLKDKLLDNPLQTDNTVALEKEIRESFEAQDAQIGSAIKTNGIIAYPIETKRARNQSVQTVESLFIKIKINELNLLRFDRMPRLAMWQWRLVYLTSIIFILLLSVSVALFIAFVRLLKRNIEAIEFMEKAIHKTEGSTRVPTKDLERLHSFLQNKSTTLEVA